MVAVSYDTAAGIIDVTARAFTPEDAHAIAEAILAESSALVNQLADQAREDAVRFAREELAEAEAHLAEMRRRARRPSAASTASSTPRPTSPGRAGS